MSFFGNSIVPIAKAQLSKLGMANQQRRPGNGVFHTMNCTILTVYDHASIENKSAPAIVLNRAQYFPNVRYCEVQVDDYKSGDGRYVLAFKETASQIWANHGNSLSLEGSRAKVEFYNTSLNSGVVTPTDDPKGIPEDMTAAINIFDIGFLL